MDRLIGEKVETIKYGIGIIVSVAETNINGKNEVSAKIKFKDEEKKLGLITFLNSNKIKFLTEEGNKNIKDVISKFEIIEERKRKEEKKSEKRKEKKKKKIINY